MAAGLGPTHKPTHKAADGPVHLQILNRSFGHNPSSSMDLQKERIRIMVQLLISDHSTVAVNPLFLLNITRMSWNCEGGCGTVRHPGSSEASKCVSES
jgi:hypothetical protein